MKKISEDTLYRYSYLSDLRANDRGDRAFFIRRTANEKRNDYDSNLYVYEGERIVRLTACNRVKEAFWLDDDRIAFVSERGAEESGKWDASVRTGDAKQALRAEDSAQNGGGCGAAGSAGAGTVSGSEEKEVRLFVKNLNEHSEAELLFHLRGSISSIDRVADARAVYLKEKKISAAEDAFFGGQENEEGYLRIRRIPFYADGGSYDFNKKTVLCLFDPESGSERELSVPDYSFFSYSLSEDRSKLLILATKIERVYRPQVAIFEYLIEEDRLHKILDDREDEHNESYSVYMACYLGRHPFFLGSSMKRHGLNENRLAYLIEDRKLRVLNGEDLDYFNSGVQDMYLGGGREYKVFDDRIEIIMTYGYETRVVSIYPDGRIEDAFRFDGSIFCFDYVDEKPVYVGLSEDRGQELYLDGRRISAFHDFLSEYYVAEAQPLSLESTDCQIDGFVLLPEGYEEGASFPALLEIHGGPKLVYQNTYFHEMQTMVAQGYVVMFCNPRGSAGKGNEFLDIFGGYGDRDYRNLMDFCDEVLRRYPKIDPERLFVTGGSYGGYKTNRIVTGTDRFRAAVTQRSICNWISMYGCSDIGYYFCPDQHRVSIEDGAFWEKLWELSPLKYVDKVRTPTLVLHSEHDFRCPLEQGYQFFTALLHRGIDSELMVFKDESHGLSREGKPKNRIARLQAIMAWFRKYDK